MHLVVRGILDRERGFLYDDIEVLFMQSVVTKCSCVFSTSCRRPRSRYLRHFVEGHQMRPVVYELYGSCFSWVGFPCGYISSITPGIFSSEMQSTEFADCKSRLTKIEMSRKEAIHAPWRSSMSVALKYV